MNNQSNRTHLFYVNNAYARLIKLNAFVKYVYAKYPNIFSDENIIENTRETEHRFIDLLTKGPSAKEISKLQDPEKKLYGFRSKTKEEILEYMDWENIEIWQTVGYMRRYTDGNWKQTYGLTESGINSLFIGFYLPMRADVENNAIDSPSFSFWDMERYFKDCDKYEKEKAEKKAAKRAEQAARKVKILQPGRNILSKIGLIKNIENKR